MATIKSQLSLNDGMSNVLKKITFALDTTLGTFEQMQRASGDANGKHWTSSVDGNVWEPGVYGWEQVE